MSEFAARLRAVVEERLAVARAAAEVVPATWLDDSGGEYVSVDEPPYMGPIIYGPYGFLGAELAAHIALNDPADVILACERDLAVLERHARTSDGCCDSCSNESRVQWWPCDEIRDLATRYRVEVE